MKPKNNYIAGVIVIIIGVCVIAGIVFYGLNQSRDENFASQHLTRARRLYERITSVDLVNDYPQTVEAVVDLFNDIALMLESDMVINPDIKRELLIIQRQLYTSELLDANPFEAQFQNLLSNTQTLMEEGFVTAGFRRGESRLDEFHQNRMIVRVWQRIRDVGDVQWDYHMRRQDGRWKFHQKVIVN